MKKLIAASLIALTALCVWAADLVVKTASGSTSATVIFPANGTQKIRVTGLMGKSDKATSVWSIRSGISAYALTATNATTSTNLYVADYTGIAANDVIILQNADGTCTAATVFGVANTTNIQLTAQIGVAGAIGDVVYELGTAQTLNVGAATVNYQGAAYHLTRGGVPVRIVLDGTSACSIDAATVSYE